MDWLHIVVHCVRMKKDCYKIRLHYYHKFQVLHQILQYNPETKFTVIVCKFVSNVEICKGFNFSVFYSRINFIINYIAVFIVKSTFEDYPLSQGKRTTREGI